MSSKNAVENSRDGDKLAQEIESGEVDVISKSDGSEVIAMRAEKLTEIKNDLLSGLKSLSSPVLPFSDEVDLLNERYQIKLQEELPKFSGNKAKAYSAIDKKDSENIIYAVVCDTLYQYRAEEAKKLLGTSHEEMVQLVDMGVVKLSLGDEYRFVMIFSKPSGQRLSEILKSNHPLSESFIQKQIVQPLSIVISSLNSVGIIHGRISPENIFISGNKTVLGECLSEPSGLSQDFICEPAERIVCLDYAKGKGASSVDVYALAVTIMQCIYDFSKIRKLSKDLFVKLLFDSIPYQIFSMGSKLPIGFTDLLVGVMNPQAKDRWDHKTLAIWVGGKRFNLVPMSSANEASRSFDFSGEPFFNCRSLANSYYKKWNLAKEDIRSNVIHRWLEQSMHKHEVSKQHQRAIKMTGGIEAKANKHNGELLSRIITILDPFGPLRFETMSFNTNGIGQLFAHAVLTNQQNELNLIITMLGFDLPAFQSDINQTMYAELADSLWKMENSRQNLTKNNIGFGIERYLYDLNPNLPCMSDRFEGYYVSNVRELLLLLNNLSFDATMDDSLLDKHISSFCAARMKITKDIKFPNLKNFEAIATNKELLCIQVLAAAQEKEKLKDLQGLAHWCAIRVTTHMSELHGSKIRDILCKKIISFAEDGNIKQVLDCITTPSILEKDRIGFNKTSDLFQKNRKNVQEMKNSSALKSKAGDIGGGVAGLVALLFFLFSIYSALNGTYI